MSAFTARQSEAEIPGEWRRKTVYGVAVFLAAFLSFQIQPLIAKLLLPWFGGAASVWTTALVFFQVGLLLGYAYAHALTHWLRPAVQGWTHLVLLATSLLALPISPDSALKNVAAAWPVLHVLLLLASTVGLPYFILSATSPLLQAWYARETQGPAPYRFYALSNAGSLLALLSYPLLFEPSFSLRHQTRGWSAAYIVACLALSVAALRSRRGKTPERPVQTDSVPWTVRTLWLALPCCSAILLLAVTNHLSQDVAPIPLLWVLPLSLYLLTFILCFEGHGWYRRNLFLRLLAVALGAMTYALQPNFSSTSLIVLLPLFLLGLFLACMVCHGELARLKPSASHLTEFYLYVSLGGAMGGVFVALVAPIVFRGFYELPLGIGGCALLVLVALRRDSESPFYKARWQPAWLIVLFLALSINASLVVGVIRQSAESRVMVRNFFGSLREQDMDSSDSRSSSQAMARRELVNGRIQHGVQFLAADRRRQPTAYYGPESGVGLAIHAAQAQGPLRVGVIGLGAGTLAAYGRPGDAYTFYEINPQVVELAKRDFTFLRDSPAKITIVTGDARLALEEEPPQDFDILVVDAFSGDAIPVHLLTREAFATYFRHLKPDGVLAVHISSSYVNLEPVVARAAAWLRKPALAVTNPNDDSMGIFRSNWILIAAQPEALASPEISRAGVPLASSPSFRLWTDDYSSLLGILKWTLN
ncbi:MAG: spermidine synthase [Deltaproteobacteria bacterium]